MEEAKYNKYSKMPIEEAIESLKIQKQKLSELKEKQRYMVQNDPDNEKLKDEFNKEWKDILGEIQDIYALNENINKINESSMIKQTSKDKNMNMEGGMMKRSEDPNIEEIKGFLTDYNSESNSEEESSYKRRMMRNQRKKNIQDRYFEVMSRNLQNIKPNSYEDGGYDKYDNKLKLDELMENRDRIDFTTSGGRFLDDYDENGHRIVN